jgi:rhodanese-related sulfurtransferase
MVPRHSIASKPARDLPTFSHNRQPREGHHMKKLVTLFGIILLFTSAGVYASDNPFPHREKFKHVQIMSPEALHKDLTNVILVDVRSRYEFETMHIKGALHIILHKEKLPAATIELRAKSAKPIVFYCNGNSCSKSYEAADLAIKAGVPNVHAYDAGLDLWSKQYPEQSVLLGKSPMNLADLISKAEFKKRLIDGPEFETRLENGAVVLDVRDLRQRDVVLFPMREMRAPLDDTKKIVAAVAEAKKSKKPLLVYDKVGKQTRWFQYYLEQQGMKDYYFLDGGSEGYYEGKYGKLNFKVPEQG